MIFRGGRLILRDAIHAGGAVRIAGGRIVEVAQNDLAPHANEEVVDLQGAFLAPGFIDLHMEPARDFVYWLKAGTAFTLPLIIALIIFVMLILSAISHT